MKDKFGTELHIGDKICFAHAEKRNQTPWLIRATITGLSGIKESWVHIGDVEIHGIETLRRLQEAYEQGLLRSPAPVGPEHIPTKKLAELCIKCY